MTNSSAAAPLFTTITSPAAGIAARRAASVARPRAARVPSARSYSTSTYPDAAISASRAAAESGARPRLVCNTVPVALMTGLRLVACAGSPRSTSSMRRAGLSDPSRTRPCDVWTASRTRARPRRRWGSASRGSASTEFVCGTARRGSVCMPHDLTGPGTASASRMRIGGGGRESNPLDRDTRSH